MKSFVVFAAFVAIAVASPLGKPVTADLAQLEEIVAAIQSPSTDPATAALLEQQLQDIISATNPEPISVGPAFIGEPISVGPALVETPIVPSPVVIGDIPEGAPTPLVQIIVNVNPAAAESTPVNPAPVLPEPVQVVEVAPTPVQVVEAPPAPVEPIAVVTPIFPAPAVVLPEDLN